MKINLKINLKINCVVTGMLMSFMLHDVVGWNPTIEDILVSARTATVPLIENQNISNPPKVQGPESLSGVNSPASESELNFNFFFSFLFIFFFIFFLIFFFIFLVTFFFFNYSVQN